MADRPKVCIDCVHCNYSTLNSSYFCRRSVVIGVKLNIVTGVNENHYSGESFDCSQERMPTWFGRSCGPDAKFFKPKEPK